MSKEILLDLDGVVVKGRHKYFSEKLAEEHNIPIDEILPFFKGEYKQAAVGEVDIKEVLPPYLEKWNWQGSVDEFLEYWFEGEREVDQRVMGVVRGLRQDGTRVHLASDNEINRARYLMDEVGLKDEFDRAFFSSELGHTKSNPVFFQKVLRELQAQPADVIYWDDDPKNIEIANQIGIQGNVYDDFDEFKEKVTDG